MIWANDALQTAFDTLNNAKGSDNYDEDDCTYDFSLTKDGPVVYRFKGGEGPNPGKVKTVKLAIEKEKGKIYYEAAFPWSSLKPFHPSLRRDMGFNLTVMDNDGDVTKFPKWKGFHQYLQISNGIC